MNPHIKPTSPLNMLTATQALAQLANGDATAKELMAACLDRISARDSHLKAWLAINPDAMAEAERLDAVPVKQRGRLHGLPIAVKDVFDTHDLPTTHNSPLFAGYRPGQDAASVDLLRAEGAIIIGKTDTTEFAAAGRDAATGNPHDLGHTSGGSSAGSAAAVADFHVPLALATQTGGSTIRPASFCGIYGFKPSFGLVSREGVKIYSNSLDTVGWYGRSVDDIALLSSVFGITETIRDLPTDGPLKIAVTLGPFRDRLAPESISALETTARRLTDGGHMVQFVELPTELEPLDEAHRTILHREGAAAFRNLARRFGPQLHDDFHHRVENRDGKTLAELRAAYDVAARARVIFDDLASDFDLVIAPSAPGFAPAGRKPGDPVFNAMWTLLGVPCLNVPVSGIGGALPIGVTMTGPRFSDVTLLAAADMVSGLVDAR
jgi:Asp-tRNA(Asn)/Glu-tRNA(Gln) amidotransferase A subunit family amidase